MKREEKGFASKDMPGRGKNTMILQHIPKDEELFIIPPAQHQHIPKLTNLFKVSETLSIGHRGRFSSFPCTYVTIVLLMNTQVYFLKPSKPLDVRKMLLFGNRCDSTHFKTYQLALLLGYLG